MTLEHQYRAREFEASQYQILGDVHCAVPDSQAKYNKHIFSYVKALLYSILGYCGILWYNYRIQLCF